MIVLAILSCGLAILCARTVMIESVQKLHAVVPLLSRSLAQDGRRLVVRAWKSPRDVEAGFVCLVLCLSV